jgi:hypothetical protein
MYSKPMATISHVLVYHVIRYNLVLSVFYMHALTNLTRFIILFKQHIFTKVEFIAYQNVFHENCKNACLAHKIFMECEKITASSM